MPAYICSPFIIDNLSSGEPGGQHAVVSDTLWKMEVGKPVVLTYWFIGGARNQRRAIESGMVTWERYANVQFGGAQRREDAVIGISFDTTGTTWCAIGATATAERGPQAKPTMNFNKLSDAFPPSEGDFGDILHELGHALGLVHEHQSDARGGHIRLNESAVYEYYEEKEGWSKQKTKLNIIDVYNLSQTSNMSAFDTYSIMMYKIPAQLNELGIDIPGNKVLSQMDKAFITLNYPRKSREVTRPGDMSVEEALTTAGVDGKWYNSILDAVNKEDYPSARAQFQEWNKMAISLRIANGTFLNSINPGPPGTQFGIPLPITKVVETPLFKSVVKNIVNQILVQRAIPTATPIPGSDEKDVLDTIGAIITNPIFAKAVQEINAQFTGLKD